MRSRPSPTPTKEETWLTQLTQSHFPWQVNTTVELPVPIRQVVLQLLTVDESIQRIIVAPFQGWLKQHSGHPSRLFRVWMSWEFTPDCVLVQTTKQILFIPVLDDGNPGAVTCVPLDQILSIQLGTVLLSSWLEVCWVEEGTCHQQRVYFNSVSEKIFTGLVQEIRCRSINREVSPTLPPQNRQALEALPFKFRNTIPIRFLLPREAVLQAVYRPAMWQKSLVFFRRLTAPRMTVVQTPTHLIFVEEDPFGDEENYDLIATFIATQALHSVKVYHAEARLDLIVSLGSKQKHKELVFSFPEATEKEIRKLEHLENE